ncbi:hypothetical protein FQA39_LY10433 [Lamprigera yunnana]|nr:hypothetical protein FQA39_LY10433 [Lamprigera yunnana]
MSSTLHVIAFIFTSLLQTVYVFSFKNSTSDSILDIINTKEVERLIAERKENASREERRYLLENALDESYLPPDQEIEYQRLKLLDTEADVYEKTENPRIDVDVLLRRNNGSDPFKSTELLSDLRGYHGRKVLKSSKNALLVTKKEYLQRDWCKTEPLVQKIKEEGCLTRTVINRFCYGQCNSFYIPKNPKKKNKRKTIEYEDEDQNGVAFKSCSFCKPKKFTWITVTLRCPNMVPQFRKKRIQRIKQSNAERIDRENVKNYLLINFSYCVSKR